MAMMSADGLVIAAARGVIQDRRDFRTAPRRGDVDVVCATGVGTVMPANTAYALDLQALSVFERPGASWDLLFSGEGMQPINQDAIAQGIMWEGELVLENPRYSARVITTPTP